MSPRAKAVTIVVGVAAGLGVTARLAAPAGAQDSPASQTAGGLSITGAIDPSVRQTLSGEVPRVLEHATDRGALPNPTALPHLTLVLRRSPAQEAALQARLAAQQDSASPDYKQWLTPEQFRASFAPAPADIAAVSTWLTAQGFMVNAVAGSGMAIDFSGTVGLVRRAFGTSMHAVSVGGAAHISNIDAPSIPRALSPLVAGIASLNDFRPHPQLKPVGAVRRTAVGRWALQSARPDFTYTDDGTYYDVAPADFATIYQVSPLRSAATPITGAGETVAVLELSDMQPADWSTFRSAFGLSGYAAAFSQVHPGGCADPGKNSAEGEAALDAEWVSAVAPAASVVEATCASSATTDGLTLALQGELAAASRPSVISVSYGQCEASLGSSGLANWSNLVEQASAEGISVVVSAGDGGSAGCDDDDTETTAVDGIAVNGLASTPYATAVGGTDFDDTAQNADGTYWSASNGASGGSAKSYIPEIPWNDSCASSVLAAYEGASSGLSFCGTEDGQGFLNIVAGSGGASTYFAKPSWQATTITGVVADGKRDIPDVSLFAGNGLWGHALLYCMSDTSEGGVACSYGSASADSALSAGGTSFAAPAFAGAVALIDQKKAALAGNTAPRLYALAAIEYGNATNAASCNSAHGATVNGACVFRNVVTGTNDVPCQPGTANCYATTTRRRGVGVLSMSANAPAYSANAGWSFAIGLGSLNVTKLVSDY